MEVIWVSGSRAIRRKDEERSLEIYMREIETIPVLTRSQEAKLARRIRQGDPEALDKLVRSNLLFVVSVARQYLGQGLLLLDLINEGNIRLLKAAKRFDETRGNKFISYAVWWIRQGILAALSEQSRTVRLPMNRVVELNEINKVVEALEQELCRKPSIEEVAKELGGFSDNVESTIRASKHSLSLNAPLLGGEDVTLIDVLEDERQPSPDADLIRESLVFDVRKMLEQITPRQAEVLDLCYGFTDGRELNQIEVGQRLDVSHQCANQLRGAGIRRLKDLPDIDSLRHYFND